MSSRRALKAAQAIREVVSTAILLELKDPRVSDVTVTMVEVAGDLRNAKVYVSVMGEENKQTLCMNGLQSASGYLQKRVGARIDTRYTPKLKFVLDKGAKNAMEVTRILSEVLPKEPEPELDEIDDSVAVQPEVVSISEPSESKPESKPPTESETKLDPKKVAADIWANRRVTNRDQTSDVESKPGDTSSDS